MKLATLLLISVLSSSAFAQPAQSTQTPKILASRGGHIATTQDLRAHRYLLSDADYEFSLRDERAVNVALEDILTTKAFAASKLALTPRTDEERWFVRYAEERARVEAMISIAQRRAEDTAAADATRLEARAKEMYLVADPSTIKREFAADFQHILFDLRTRPFVEVSQRIAAVEKALTAGANFDALVSEYSDEPKARDTLGKFDRVPARTMDGNLARTVFDNLKPGEYSKPVASRLGIHIIKLNAIHAPEKRPFEEVKAAYVAKLIADAGKQARADELRKFSVEPTEFNVDALKSLLVKPDPAAIQLALDRALEAAKRSSEDAVDSQREKKAP